MSLSLAVWGLLILAVVAANLPWLSERVLFVFPAPGGVKGPWLRLAEWLLLYVIVGGIALGLEQKSFGGRHVQDWEFYAVTLCLFLVFALPGFIYRYDLKGHLERARRRRR
ncbi:MAG: DUF2818 family protein [Gammaproteobacteria bacterium]|nr:DUF2818 family protein [Gammaproteobacteria bacterium]